MKQLFALCLSLCLLLTVLPVLGDEARTDIVIPEIETKEHTIPDSEAMAFLRRMGIGWNLGNTFDAVRDNYFGDDLAIERYWCGVYTSREMIQALADAGFGFIRIPVSWHNHVDKDFNINPAWLDRVQEVVDWVLESGMMAIVTVQHDNDKKYFYPDSEHLDSSLKYLSAIWTQLAERFRDYPDTLLLESMNEPRLVGTSYEWSFNQNNKTCQDAAACIDTFNQTFVDIVRASGGNNADRYLLLPGYDASTDNVNRRYFHLPTDTADNRLIVAAHAYVPYDFALNTKGTDKFSYTRRADVSPINSALKQLYELYIKQGVPAVMDEFGCLLKGDNLQARVEHVSYYVANATSYGIPVAWWDNNAFAGSGENFGLLRRQDVTWPFPELVEAMMKYKLK